MLQEFIEAHEIIMRQHQDLLSLLQRLLRTAIENRGNLEEQADALRVFRESAELFDNLRKRYKAAEDSMTREVAQAWCLLDNGGEPIRTEYSTYTPSIRTAASIPKLKKDPKKYYALMDYLGIPREVSEKDLARVHWPAFVEHITALLEEGKPLPPGIDTEATYTTPQIRIRINKPISEGKKGEELDNPF